MDATIYAGEWKLMEKLWDESPQTLMELVRALGEEVGWSKSTVATMVRRMEAKGIYPTLTREEASRAETNGLIDKVFRGSPGLLMASLLERNDFSPGEIDELYAMLKKAEEASGKNA